MKTMHCGADAVLHRKRLRIFNLKEILNLKGPKSSNACYIIEFITDIFIYWGRGWVDSWINIFHHLVFKCLILCDACKEVVDLEDILHNSSTVT